MPDVSAIPIVGSVVDTVTGIVGSDDADDSMQQATQQANNQQLAMYNQMRSDLSPWTEAGKNYLQDYAYQLSYGAMNPTELYYYQLLHDYVTGARPEFSFAGVQDPSIGYIQDQALKATERGAAARTGVLSGSTQNALQKNAANIASTYWQNAYQNALNKYGQDVNAYGTNVSGLQNLFNTYHNTRQNYLQSILSGAQLGQNAAATTGAGALTTGNQLANNTLLSGLSSANNAVSQANALGGGISNFGQNLSTLLSSMNRPNNTSSYSGQWAINERGGGPY